MHLASILIFAQDLYLPLPLTAAAHSRKKDKKDKTEKRARGQASTVAAGDASVEKVAAGFFGGNESPLDEEPDIF